MSAFEPLWHGLIWPLLRLLCGLAAGLLLASILESLRWTEKLARLTAPCSRLAHFGETAGAAFALAFVSPAAANGLLAAGHDQKKISRRELVLANLFNGLPASIVHAPTIFFITWPAVGFAAVIYVCLTLLAALLRTCFTILLARFMLPAKGDLREEKETATGRNVERKAISSITATVWRRFRRRLPRLVFFTVPFYILMWLCQQYGFFQAAQGWFAQNLQWLSFIKPQAMSIVILQIVAEMGATLGAASAALQDGALSCNDVALAMLAGNIIAAPMHVIRHQFPAYAGFFQPALALRLIFFNQLARAASLILVLYAYALLYV